jgi:hypothetical protein
MSEIWGDHSSEDYCGLLTYDTVLMQTYYCHLEVRTLVATFQTTRYQNSEIYNMVQRKRLLMYFDPRYKITRCKIQQH